MEQKRYYLAITALSEDITESQALDIINGHLRQMHEIELTDAGNDLILGTLKRMKIGCPNVIHLRMLSITEREFYKESAYCGLIEMGIRVELRPH